MNSNVFSAADMSTAAANRHRDGYQAGYADAVKAIEAAQPAAAQEAVAWQVGDDFYTSESLAIEGIQQWGPSGSIAIPLYAAPVAAAPAVDVAILRALADRWATDRSYTGSPVDDIRALIEKPTMSTPAAPGIDLAQFKDLIGFAAWSAINLPETDPRRDFIRQASELLALIDASPKGGSTDPRKLPCLSFAVFDEFGVGADDRVADYGRACATAAMQPTSADVKP